MKQSLPDFELKALQDKDARAFYDTIRENEDRLSFFAGTLAKTRTLEDTVRYMSEIDDKRRRKEYLPYLLLNKSTGEILGFADAKNIDWNIPKAELGLFLDRSVAGMGLSLPVMREFCTLLFDEHQFAKLFLRTHVENKAARALAERMGFVLEGVLRQDYRNTAGLLVDLAYYGKLREENL